LGRGYLSRVKCDYDHYKILNVIMTVTVLLRLATHEQICDVRTVVQEAGV